MQRGRVIFSVLGLLVAASAAQADVPAEMTLLGQKYSLAAHNLGGTYDKGGTVVLAPEENSGLRGAQIQFVQGETPEQDRMFVVHTPQQLDDIVATAFYQLRGADPATGVFDKKTTNLTLYFGGEGDYNKHGRPANITFISDVDTGKQKDRNIAFTAFVDPDSLVFYDLDTLSNDFVQDQVLLKVQRQYDIENGDPHQPYGGFTTGALAPDGKNVIFAGRGEAGAEIGPGIQIGVMDPTSAEGNFFPVLTSLVTATQDQDTPIDETLDIMDFERIAGNEYLLLASIGTGNAVKTIQVLYRLRITLPEDLTKEAPNSIKVEVLGSETILDTDLNDPTILVTDLLGLGDTGVVGMAVGRAVADGGPHRLYFTGSDGSIVTANPVAAAGN